MLNVNIIINRTFDIFPCRLNVGVMVVSADMLVVVIWQQLAKVTAITWQLVITNCQNLQRHSNRQHQTKNNSVTSIYSATVRDAALMAQHLGQQHWRSRLDWLLVGMCGIDLFLFRFGFSSIFLQKKTWIRFVMCLVQFGSTNAVRIL